VALDWFPGSARELSLNHPISSELSIEKVHGFGLNPFIYTQGFNIFIRCIFNIPYTLILFPKVSNMQITSYTDYALRVLIYLARSPDRQTTITEAADFFNISRNHLVKVVHQLGNNGFVKTTRGKGGGLALQRPPEKISIGDVVRSMENHFNWVECFDPAKQHCRLLPNCGLKQLFARAGNAYLDILDSATLADVTLGKTLS
jgi:Rrf2 family nitric oxide-sensitive transcriptional repressor